MEEEYDYYLKLIVLGVQSVGKTAIVQRFCYDCFEEDTLKTTLGFDFLTKVLQHKGKRVQLQIWDTAGQERFRSVTKMYYQDVNGVILVYDLTSRSTLNSLQFWFDDLELNGTKAEKRMLVGNKLDLEKAREVPQIDGKKLATEQNMDWVECSAKTGEGVADLFHLLIDKMLADFHSEPVLELTPDDIAVLPRPKARKRGKKKKNAINGQPKTKKGCCG